MPDTTRRRDQIATRRHIRPTPPTSFANRLSEAPSESSAPDVEDRTGPAHTRVAKQPTSSLPAQPRLGVAAADPAPGARTARAAQTKSASVDIGDNFFSPKELTISVGTTVTWTNKGQRPHTSTADDGSWDSGDDPQDYILPGESFSHTFTSAGEFPYYCRLHGGREGVGQAGVITVSASGEPARTTDAPAETTPGAQTTAAGPEAADASNGALAATGAERLLLAPVGLAMIAAGGALLLVARRRPA